MKLLPTLATIMSMSLTPTFADITAELAAIESLGTMPSLQTAPALYSDDTTPGTPDKLRAGDRKAIYYEALDYKGKPTRVYAWVNLPKGATADKPVPGVVLVHGGGGTAFDTWVDKWSERGYAAISIAVEGQTDLKGEPALSTGWSTHAMSGPFRSGIYNDTEVRPLSDQWMYHCVADTMIANSLLRSLEFVDADKVGVMGVSWGGVITSTVIGIDRRFAFAIPVYGCGHLCDARNIYQASLAGDPIYEQGWDPYLRLEYAEMPTLWYSWPEEPHFPMHSLAKCYRKQSGPTMVSLVHKMGHGHGSAWNRPESYDFADSIVQTGKPWGGQESLRVDGPQAEVTFHSRKPLHSAFLYTTPDEDTDTKNLELSQTWTETALTTPTAKGDGTYTVTATIPEGTKYWYINAEASATTGYNDKDLVLSGEFQSVE